MFRGSVIESEFFIVCADLHIFTRKARLRKARQIIEIDGMKILFIGILTEAVLSRAPKRINGGKLCGYISGKSAAGF